MHFSKFHARFCGPTSEPVFRAGFLIPLIIVGLEVRPLSGRIFKPAFRYFLQFFRIFRCAFVPVFGQVWHGNVAVGNGLVLGVYRCRAEHSSRLKEQAENTTNGLTRIGPKRRPSSTMRLRGLAPQMVTAIRVHGLVGYGSLGLGWWRLVCLAIRRRSRGVCVCWVPRSWAS